MRQRLQRIWDKATRLFKEWTARENLWMTGPVLAAAVLVLLVLVKSCQGIAFFGTSEFKLCKMGYPAKEAHTIAAVLTDKQIDTLVDLGEMDTLACAIVTQPYFIGDNLERYLNCHKNLKSDTIGFQPADIVAMVNVGADNNWQDLVPCDTTKGYLMLINRSHSIDERYRNPKMVTFEKDYAFGEHRKADTLVVSAYYMMRQACHQQTKAHLMVNSAYRSFKEQQDTHKQNSKRLAAKAGYSEHQTGLCLDIVSQEHLMKWEFGESTEGKWVRDHCHEYGFILRYPEGKEHITGYDYEPWHLRYVGKEAAQRIHDEGITLDEYYAYYIERETR